MLSSCKHDPNDTSEFERVVKKEVESNWAYLWQEALRQRRDGKCEWPLTVCERASTTQADAP